MSQILFRAKLARHVMRMACLFAGLLLPAWTMAATLHVLRQGPAPGRIVLIRPGVPNVDIDNYSSFSIPDATTGVQLSAEDVPYGRFLRWEGSINSSDPTIDITLAGIMRVRAVYQLRKRDGTACDTLLNFTPEGVRDYLNVPTNDFINTPARFLAILPFKFRQNWILMTRSESLQAGTAYRPRLLLPDETGQFVFSISLATHRSYPGSHPLAIEYMQFDLADSNFRFHEVILGNVPQVNSPLGVQVFPARSRSVTIDDHKCFNCHSTRNVKNVSGSPGTTGDPIGSVPYKSKPNWDTYDSWAGMLAFNRDRIYQGSLEAAAFRFHFNPWSHKDFPEVRDAMMLLTLQPDGILPQDQITRIVGGDEDGRIRFAFDPAGPAVTREPTPAGTSSISTNYRFDNAAGSGTSTLIQRHGNLVTLRHSEFATRDGIGGEGRGVKLFDLLSVLNAQRVADELVTQLSVTGNHLFDLRPIALAIIRNHLSISGGAIVDNVADVDLNDHTAFLTARNKRNPTQILADTRDRAFSLPRRKADIQRWAILRTGDPYTYTPTVPSPTNLAGPAPGLLDSFRRKVTYPATFREPFDTMRQEVFRRSLEPSRGYNDRSIMGGIYTDREDESPNVMTLALFRYFLEPFGTSVDKWNMGVRGRSRTYTFADGPIFGAYRSTLTAALQASLQRRPVLDAMGNPLAAHDPGNPADLIRAVNRSFEAIPTDVREAPTFTDVQRIFNKSCIECHGGLNYPPFSSYMNGEPGALQFQEDETIPPAGLSDEERRQYRLRRSWERSRNRAGAILPLITDDSEAMPGGMMPYGGPQLTGADIQTIERWIAGGTTFSIGDPHLRTADGTHYDFQGHGEYVLLKGDFFEVQARMQGVSTAGAVGPDVHHGLTTCVSLNTGVAIRIGGHRITYLPDLSGQPNPDGLQLRIDGQITTLPAGGLAVGRGNRILPAGENGAIRIQEAGGAYITVQPGWWDHYQVWYMNIDIQRAPATRGLMGYRAPGSWLPYLSDGRNLGEMPEALGARLKLLYSAFGESWRVTDSTTLFDYAPGTSTATFTQRGWPNVGPECVAPENPGGIAPPKGMSRAEAEKLCTEIKDPQIREFCIQDIMATGAPVFAATHRATDIVRSNRPPSVPELLSPKNFADPLSLPLRFEWRQAQDPDGDPITYRHEVWLAHESPDLNLAVAVAGPGLEEGGGSIWTGAKGCGLIALLVGLGIWLILFILLRNKLHKGILALLLLLVFIVAAIAYALCNKKQDAVPADGVFKHQIESLEANKAYYWRIIAEDGKGGMAESRSFYFTVQ